MVMSGEWVDRNHPHTPSKMIILDMDSSEIPPMATRKVRLTTGISAIPVIILLRSSRSVYLSGSGELFLRHSVGIVRSNVFRIRQDR